LLDYRSIFAQSPGKNQYEYNLDKSVMSSPSTGIGGMFKDAKSDT